MKLALICCVLLVASLLEPVSTAVAKAWIVESQDINGEGSEWTDCPNQDGHCKCSGQWPHAKMYCWFSWNSNDGSQPAVTTPTPTPQPEPTPERIG